MTQPATDEKAPTASTPNAAPARKPADQVAWEALSDRMRFRIWAKHEDVAVHFNDLAARLRIQALAGIAAVTAVAGSVFQRQGRLQTFEIGCFLCAMAVVWIAVWIFDAGYYHALVQGAVNRILVLESWSPELALSTAIRDHAEASRAGRRTFYALILLVLGGSGVAMVKVGRTEAPGTNAGPTPTVTAPAPTVPDAAAPDGASPEGQGTRGMR